MFAVIGALALLVGGVLAVTRLSGSSVLGKVEVAAGAAQTPSVSGTWAVAKKPTNPTSFTVADAVVPQVQLFAEPNVPMPQGSRQSLDNPTWEGLPVLFLVEGRKGAFLHVQVSSRPNGLRAWVRSDDVKLRTVPNWVKVELAKRTVTVFHGDTVLMTAPAAIGRDSAPTPVGKFFVDGIVHLRDRNGPYGSGQVSVSGFSDVYETFGSGIGQIAIHGTAATGLLGQGVSHGCVRIANDDLDKLSVYAATGTPVEIVP